MYIPESGRFSRPIHFGDTRYQQYKDSTGLGIYSNFDHMNMRRREMYFLRHSGVYDKDDAIKIELKKSRGKMNAKILSHMFLW